MSLVGRTLSHYQMLAEVSRGGMGVVSRACDTRLDREIALRAIDACVEATNEHDRSRS